MKNSPNLARMSHEDAGRALTGDSHIEYLKRERRSVAMGFPITLALLGFAIYGVRELEASWQMALVGVAMPVIFLLGITFSYLSLSRRIARDARAEAQTAAPDSQRKSF